MLHEISTKLTITLDTSAGIHFDQPNAVTATISTELSDCSVHAWFQVFEQVLAMAGFQEQVVMQGAAQLAFNETREVEAMRKIAALYDLRLQEDLPESSDEPGAVYLP